jgi:hypothetical protein
MRPPLFLSGKRIASRGRSALQPLAIEVDLAQAVANDGRVSSEEGGLKTYDVQK